MSPRKLTDAQLVLLSTASQREDGAINVAGTRKDGKSIGKLLNEGLVEEIPARGKLPVWRRDLLAGAPGLEPGNGGIKIQLFGPTIPATIRQDYEIHCFSLTCG